MLLWMDPLDSFLEHGSACGLDEAECHGFFSFRSSYFATSLECGPEASMIEAALILSFGENHLRF